MVVLISYIICSLKSQTEQPSLKKKIIKVSCGGILLINPVEKKKKNAEQV